MLKLQLELISSFAYAPSQQSTLHECTQLKHERVYTEEMGNMQMHVDYSHGIAR